MYLPGLGAPGWALVSPALSSFRGQMHWDIPGPSGLACCNVGRWLGSCFGFNLHPLVLAHLSKLQGLTWSCRLGVLGDLGVWSVDGWCSCLVLWRLHLLPGSKPPSMWPHTTLPDCVKVMPKHRSGLDRCSFVMSGICWWWLVFVSDDQCCWQWLVIDGVQTDYGFSFDAAPTIDTVLYFRW